VLNVQEEAEAGFSSHERDVLKRADDCAEDLRLKREIEELKGNR
jgi:hypothetical protein